MFHPTASDHTFFSSTHGTFSRIAHTLAHKTSLNKFKNFEILSSIFFSHDDAITEIDYKNIGQFTNMQRLNSMLLNGSKKSMRNQNIS